MIMTNQLYYDANNMQYTKNRIFAMTDSLTVSATSE